MTRGVRRFVGHWFVLAAALAIVGVGLDALPTELLLAASTREADADSDDAPNDVEDGLEVSCTAVSAQVQPRRKPNEPNPSPLELAVPATPACAMSHTRISAVPLPRRLTLLCRFLC